MQMFTDFISGEWTGKEADVPPVLRQLFDEPAEYRQKDGKS
jgi:hypothetical protein